MWSIVLGMVDRYGLTPFASGVGRQQADMQRQQQAFSAFTSTAPLGMVPLVCVFMYLCMYVHMYVHMYVCVHIL